MQRICVDMDEVMSDTLGELLRRYNVTFGESLRPEDLAGKGIWRGTPPEHKEKLGALLNTEEFFEDLELMPGAQEVLRDLSGLFEIFIATQAMAVPNSLGSKFRWLQRHFTFIPADNYVFCGSKSILRADYLIDDAPRNLRAFAGQGLLFTAPHNVGVEDFLRVNNWPEVAEYFANIKSR